MSGRDEIDAWLDELRTAASQAERKVFTPEQEARVAEIVREVLLGIERNRAQRNLADMELDLGWAIYRAGFSQPEGPSGPQDPFVTQGQEHA